LIAVGERPMTGNDTVRYIRWVVSAFPRTMCQRHAAKRFIATSRPSVLRYSMRTLCQTRGWWQPRRRPDHRPGSGLRPDRL